MVSNLTFLYHILQDTPICGLFAIIDQKGKGIYLGYSQDVLIALMTNMREIQAGLHVSKELIGKPLDFLILEDCIEEEYPLRFNYWLDKYINMGYTDYRKYKPISYSFCTTVKKYPLNQNYSPKVFLELVSKNRKKRILLGIFETRETAKRFIYKHYSKGIYKIYRSSNKLTYDYLNSINSL